MRNWMIAIMLTCFCLGLSACEYTQSGETTDGGNVKTILTERQKEILLSEALPANFEQLNVKQKQAIVAIEEMLCTTENKYGVSMVYVSYSDGGYIGYEELTAYPVGGDINKDVFTITRKKENDSYVYSDGYMNLIVKPIFTEFVQDFVFSIVGQENAKVYSVVTKIQRENYPFNKEDMAHNVGGSSWIFVDSANVTEEKFKELATEYEEWIEENGIVGSTQLIFVNPNILAYLTEYNYTNYLSLDYCITREHINYH